MTREFTACSKFWSTVPSFIWNNSNKLAAVVIVVVVFGSNSSNSNDDVYSAVMIANLR